MTENMSTPGQCFTATYPGIARSIITAAEIESSLEPKGRIQVRAVWDTGATGSLIRPEVARQLDLPSISKTLINTPSCRDIPSNIYLIDLYLPNQAVITMTRVLEGIPLDCDILIGMNIISQGDFAISNYNGRMVFSFRMPSMTEIDFCKHSYLTADQEGGLAV